MTKHFLKVVWSFTQSPTSAVLVLLIVKKDEYTQFSL